MILAFSACDLFSFGSSGTGIQAPAVTPTTEALVVTPTTITSTPYITIIRYNLTDNSSSATIKTDATSGEQMKYVVGQITPGENVTKGYQFSDNYVGSGDYYYQYAARYKITNGYSYSNATGTIALIAGATDRYEQRVYSEAADKKIWWDDKAFTLKFAAEEIYLSDAATGRAIYDSNEEILNPLYRGADLDTTKNQRRMMVALSLNDGASTRLFPLDLISELDSGGNTNWYYYVALRDVLPSAFYDVNLTVEGFTLQEREIKYWDNYTDIDEHEVRQIDYHWTIPCTEYDVYDASTGDKLPLNIIAVTTNTSEEDTFDYTEPVAYSNARSVAGVSDEGTVSEESVEAPIELFRGFSD